MPRIFISYRRDDTGSMVGRLFDRLADEFDHQHVFRDIYSIEGGEDFAGAIDRRLRESDVVLVLIGGEWLAPVGEGGRPRLEDPEDFVRIEIETALRLARVVIPVLVERRKVPPKRQVPDSLQPLFARQAMSLADSHFDYDVGKLIERLHRIDDGDLGEEAAMDEPPGRLFGIPRAWLTRGLMASLVVAVVGLIREAFYPLIGWPAILAYLVDHLPALLAGVAVLGAIVWFVVRGSRERPREGFRRVMRRLHHWSERRSTAPILLSVLLASAVTMWVLPEGVTITERPGPPSNELRARLFIDSRAGDDQTQQCPGDRSVGDGELAFACRYYEIRIFTGLLRPASLDVTAVVEGFRQNGGVAIPASVSWADAALERTTDPQWVFRWEIGNQELTIGTPSGPVPRTFTLLATRQHDPDAPPDVIRITVRVGFGSDGPRFERREEFDVEE